MILPVAVGAFRILDLDIENRPLSYWYDDRPTAEITAIAACWVGDVSPEVYLLGRDNPKRMLQWFVGLYDQADMVTGHFIRKHDLPIINGALQELGLEVLKPKLAEDTKLDLVVRGDIPATQEHLAEMFHVKAAKQHVTQAEWREANRLTDKGIALTERRVSADVIQHMQLRVALHDAGVLGPPKVWRP
jgi:hypothetical protein